MAPRENAREKKNDTIDYFIAFYHLKEPWRGERNVFLWRIIFLNFSLTLTHSLTHSLLAIFISRACLYEEESVETIYSPYTSLFLFSLLHLPRSQVADIGQDIVEGTEEEELHIGQEELHRSLVVDIGVRLDT